MFGMLPPCRMLARGRGNSYPQPFWITAIKAKQNDEEGYEQQIAYMKNMI